MRGFWSWWIRRRGLIGQLACILYVAQRPLGPYRTIYWRRKRRILAVLLIVLSCLAATWPQPWPQPRPATLPAPALVRAAAGQSFVPIDYEDDARSVPPQSAGVGSVAGMTREEAKAIDQRFLEKWHWKLSPGTCGMLGCAVHGGGWIKAAGEKPKEVQRRTHTEYRRAGLFRRRTIAVEVDDPLEETKRQPSAEEQPTGATVANPAERVAPRSAMPSAAASCPGGSYPSGGT